MTLVILIALIGLAVVAAIALCLQRISDRSADRWKWSVALCAILCPILCVAVWLISTVHLSVGVPVTPAEGELSSDAISQIMDSVTSPDTLSAVLARAEIGWLSEEELRDMIVRHDVGLHAAVWDIELRVGRVWRSRVEDVHRLNQELGRAIDDLVADRE